MEQFDFSTDKASEYSDDLMEAAKHFADGLKILVRVSASEVMQESNNNVNHKYKVAVSPSRSIDSLHDQEALTLSVGEVSKIMGLSRNSVYELIRTSQIPSMKFGKRILIPLKKLEMMLS